MEISELNKAMSLRGNVSDKQSPQSDFRFSTFSHPILDLNSYIRRKQSLSLEIGGCFFLLLFYLSGPTDCS